MKGENPPEPGVPESCNVLVKELKSLALNIELIKKEKLTDESRLVDNIAAIS